jgi:endo-1,4-beta-mannosidase
MKRILSLTTIILLFISVTCLSAENPPNDLETNGRWSAERAHAWYGNQSWLIGCNFIPSTSVNQLEMWQEETFDPETIDRELGWASDIGFNIIRVYLHDMLWQQDYSGFMNRIDQFLTIAKKHNIKVIFVLLDSCWNPHPKLGKQPESKPHVHNSGWVQSPHVNLLKDTAAYGKLKGYVKGIVGRYRNDDRVIVWDVYNEPGNRNGVSYGAHEPPNKDEFALKLLEKAFT